MVRVVRVVWAMRPIALAAGRAHGRSGTMPSAYHANRDSDGRRLVYVLRAQGSVLRRGRVIDDRSTGVHAGGARWARRAAAAAGGEDPAHRPAHVGWMSEPGFRVRPGAAGS